MAASRLSGFASTFDDMLEHGRRELEALAGGALVDPSRRSSEAPSRGAAHTEGAAAPAPSRTSAERALDERLGPGWRYEVVERIREGGELTVRCRVHAPARGITRTVYGSAPVSGSRPRVSGSAGGTAFSLGAERAPGVGGGAVAAERDAERRAVDSALAVCARLVQTRA